jgi:hypothetical protein
VNDVLGWIGDRGVNAPRLPIIAAALIGIAALMRRRVSSWALLCAVFALWSLPVFIASFTSRGAAASFVFGASTFDVALTSVLTPALLWAYREQRSDLTPMLVLALVVSTVLAWSNSITSGMIGRSATDHLSLLLPVLWSFVLNARALNRHSAERPAVLLGGMGLATATLALASYQVTANRGASSLGDIIAQLVTPPLAAVLVAATITSWRRPATHSRAPSPSG